MVCKDMDPSVFIKKGESLDDLRLGGLRVLQSKEGYRFSLDPVLLCSFGREGAGSRAVDLGTGSGVIPLVLSRITNADLIVGVEVQAAMAERARRSVELNGLGEKVEIREGDIREIKDFMQAQCCDSVFCNPPYRRVESGRVAPGEERSRARHEIAGGIEAFIGAASWLLGDGGRFYIVYLAERLAELMGLMRESRIEPKRLRTVHSRMGEEARLVLVEGRKGGRPGLKVESPLVIFEGEEYTEELLEIYDG